LAEGIGTAMLVAAVIGSGIAAQRLSPSDVGLQLFENTAATAAALVAIILALGAVSGAHLNPVVTLVDRVLGGLTNREAAVYVGSQIAGGALGAVVANLMFDESAISWSTHHRATGAHLLGEVVATFGLVLVVFGVVRSGRSAAAPFAVAAYIAAAYWFTSSTSFANPAVTFARTLSNTFAGIAPSSAPAFVGAQLVGGAVGLACVIALYPSVSDVAGDVVLPHAGSATDGGGARR
jgi:glycerol uptake facilitator-like aquaporin